MELFTFGNELCQVAVYLFTLFD